MTVATTPTPVGDVVAGLGEGPLWDAGSGIVFWLDIPNGNLHRTDPADGATTTRHFGAPLALALQSGDGTLLLARGDELFSLATFDAEPRGWVTFPHRENMRINDGTWDRAGRLIVGTMVLPDHEGGPAGLWRVERDGALREVFGGLRLSNGVAWSPDGTRLYHVDTPVRRVWVHDVDVTGEIAGSRVLAEIEPGAGNPDGITVDAEGCIWVCLFGGWAVRRYDPEGRHVGEVRLPVQHVTACAFGGDDLATLFVTSASNRLGERGRAEQPLAGRLLAVRPGVAGYPAARGTPPDTVPTEEPA